MDQHEESLEYDLLSVDVCSKGCGRNDDWCGGRKAQRLRIIENQFEVLGNLDEENVDSEGESTAIPSDNASSRKSGAKIACGFGKTTECMFWTCSLRLRRVLSGRVRRASRSRKACKSTQSKVEE